MVIVIRALLKSKYSFYLLSPAQQELFKTVCTIWNMESSEHGASEAQGFSDKDSVQNHRTPEKLSSVIDFNEALIINTFSEMYIAQSPVSRRLESETS